MKLPQIYVSCLPSDDSKLDKWVDSNQSLTEIMVEIQSVIEESLYKNPLIAEFIDEQGDLGKVLISEYGYEKAKTMMKEKYHGQYESKDVFVEEALLQVISEEWLEYFDYVAFKRDLFAVGYCAVELPDAVHIFSK